MSDTPTRNELSQAAAHLQRRARVPANLAVEWLDGPPPSEAEMNAALAAVRGRKVWSRLEFLGRWTPEEVQAVVRRASLSAATSPSAVAVAAVWARFCATTTVESTSPTLAAAMQVLVDAGLITAERRDAILTGD